MPLHDYRCRTWGTMFEERRPVAGGCGSGCACHGG